MSKTVDAEQETKGNDIHDGADEPGIVLPWEQDIQFYVHLAFLNKKLLDGHKLLLGSMLTSPESKDVKSFLDLFVEQDEDASNGNDDSECQCYEKMVFCGYDGKLTLHIVVESISNSMFLIHNFCNIRSLHGKWRFQ